ncbi:MAG TPA: WYL domain-containing transcriptional regulator [Desulfobacteraceae bacterium]|nr:WYL domain-containing transcriptional regulator [Desulfobacteraceae bacterium]
MSLLERIYYFHSRIRDNRYPNSGDLIREFEVSTATAHRDISYLRDRLLAPLTFSKRKNGYYYTDADFRLPFEDTPGLILLLGLLEKIAGEAGLDGLPEMRRLRKKLSSIVSPGRQAVDDLIHCEWIETETVSPVVFGDVLNGLLSRTALNITYRSPAGDISERDIDPLKLVHYQGRWYILSWCFLRCSRRMFHLGRITRSRRTDRPVSHTLSPDDDWLEGAFGIFKGDTKSCYPARILLTGTAAEIVRRQHWHPGQTAEESPEGLVLSLPVADDRELIMKVLQFGSQARILEPDFLRGKVRDEIAKMAVLYEDSRP